MTQLAQDAIYSLELTEKEAGILKIIIGKIGGGGPGRKFIDDLYAALIDIEPADALIIGFSGNFSSSDILESLTQK